MSALPRTGVTREMKIARTSIFSELSPAPKLSVWRGFKGDVLLRGCAWLKTRSVTSKRRSPSAFPALEFLPRTFFVASDLSYPTKGDGNRDAELGQRVITGRSIIKDRPFPKCGLRALYRIMKLSRVPTRTLPPLKYLCACSLTQKRR
ncbi:hypothetical protein HZH68_004242 [Vespula germanica]|uniref:Uncharacterized protein n=1 Tax=Vespula germanica TaxID=30212 RepID=A0A834KTI1_VESGE|nr:hypothetical protein HZH68_004242 [Vespula germanica]